MMIFAPVMLLLVMGVAALATLVLGALALAGAAGGTLVLGGLTLTGVAVGTFLLLQGLAVTVVAYLLAAAFVAAHLRRRRAHWRCRKASP